MLQTQPTPARVPEQTPTIEELRLDVAWEARRNVAYRIGCRVCGKFVRRLGGKDGHLWLVHQMSTRDYHIAFPGARLFDFACIARQHNQDAQELMAAFAANYFKPEEILDGRKDMKWETGHKIGDAVMCRECGRRVRAELSVHLRLKHRMILAEYEAKWPGVPTRSDARRRQGVEWWKNNPVKAIAKNKTNNARKKLRVLPAGLSERPKTWQLIVPVLVADRVAGGHISNQEVCKMFGFKISKETMNDIRRYCAVPGPRGRPKKSCK